MKKKKKLRYSRCPTNLSPRIKTNHKTTYKTLEFSYSKKTPLAVPYLFNSKNRAKHSTSKVRQKI